MDHHGIHTRGYPNLQSEMTIDPRLLDASILYEESLASSPIQTFAQDAVSTYVLQQDPNLTTSPQNLHTDEFSARIEARSQTQRQHVISEPKDRSCLASPYGGSVYPFPGREEPPVQPALVAEEESTWRELATGLSEYNDRPVLPGYKKDFECSVTSMGPSTTSEMTAVSQPTWHSPYPGHFLANSGDGSGQFRSGSHALWELESSLYSLSVPRYFCGAASDMTMIEDVQSVPVNTVEVDGGVAYSFG